MSKRLLGRGLLATTLAVGSITGSAVGLFGAPQAVAAAPDGFSCNGQIFYVATSTEQVRLRLGTAGPGTVTFSLLGPSTARYNAMGVNPVTQYINAMRIADAHMVQVNKAGQTTDLG